MDNRISYRTLSPKHKKKIKEAARLDSRSLSSLMRTYTVLIVRLIENSFNPEFVLKNLEEIIDLLEIKKRDGDNLRRENNDED